MGRLDALKGVDLLIEAFSRLIKRGIDASYRSLAADRPTNLGAYWVESRSYA